MGNLLYTNTLQIDSDKFLITKRLYQEMFSQMNYLSDYGKCRVYVRKAMSKCLREVKEVREFEVKKIDIEL